MRADKPRIRRLRAFDMAGRVGTFWRCASSEAVAYGDTPAAAWGRWCWVLSKARRAGHKVVDPMPEWMPRLRAVSGGWVLGW